MKKLTAKQVAAMTPESRERYERKLKTVMRNRRILTGIIAVIAVAAIFAVLSVTVLFTVDDIQVARAGSYYKAQEIIDASGVELGDSIIGTNWNKVKSRVESKLPYVFNLEIGKSLSGKVVFTVTDNKAAMYIQVKGGYAVTDANGKVLEITNGKPKKNGLCLLKLKNEIKTDIGSLIEFSDEKEKKLYDNIRAAINEAKIANITGIDITDYQNIYLEYQNRYRLYIGDSTDLSYKLKEAKKVIAQEDENDPKQIGEINLSILKKVYVNKLETLEKTTAPATTKPVKEETTVPVKTDENTGENDSEQETTNPVEEETTVLDNDAEDDNGEEDMPEDDDNAE